ncbi:pentatricopeptide repeat-containing protein At2g40720-like [Primulina huaijiensis]|uniref:pentatricopeptide repeat-containing protein At2g40720-like n=1 Tax=Primulina huaijiensis TaxID=1492673 RepID=UPI003CC77CC4
MASTVTCKQVEELVNERRKGVRRDHSDVFRIIPNPGCYEGITDDDFSENFNFEANPLSRRVNGKAKTLVQQACAYLSNVLYGGFLLSMIIKMGLQYQPFLTTSLLDMYMKCGWLRSAVNLFDIVSQRKISVRDVVLWNYIIDRLLKNGICDTLCILLGLCNHILDIVCGTEIHAYVMRNAYDDRPFLGKQVQYSCLKCNDQWILEKWIESLAKSVSLELGSTAFSSVLTACSQSDDIGNGCQIHSDAVMVGFEKDPFVSTSLITFYSKCGLLKDAERVFYMPDANIIATVIIACTGLNDEILGFCVHGLSIKKGLNLNFFAGSSLIDFYSRRGLPDIAKRVYSNVSLKNLVVWNYLLSCCYQNGLPDISTSLLSQILQHGLFPDFVSITTVLPAVSSMAALLKCRTWLPYTTPDS